MNTGSMPRHHETFDLLRGRFFSLFNEDDLISGPERMVGGKRETIVDNEVGSGFELFLHLEEGYLM